MALYGLLIALMRPVLSAISKPLSRRAKIYARTHPAFRAYCLQLGTVMQKIENRVAAIGGWKPQYRYLNEDRILESASELLAEVVVLVVPVGWIVYDYSKKQKKAEEEHLHRLDNWKRLDKMEVQLSEVKRVLSMDPSRPRSLGPITHLEQQLSGLQQRMSELSTSVADLKKENNVLRSELTRRTNVLRREQVRVFNAATNGKRSSSSGDKGRSGEQQAGSRLPMAVALDHGQHSSKFTSAPFGILSRMGINHGFFSGDNNDGGKGLLSTAEPMPEEPSASPSPAHTPPIGDHAPEKQT